jgi:hypothetical protein
MEHLFSTFPKFVDTELNRRRTDNRPGEPTALQKPKSPWMRMTSGFKADSGGREEGRKILMGGDLDLEQKLQFGFENLYEESAPTGEKYRPKPTLTDISVDEQLDSFECTVNWKAHSIDQVERLFPFFMNVGSSIFVDWGWSDVPPEAITNVSDTVEIARYYQSIGGSLSTSAGGMRARRGDELNDEESEEEKSAVSANQDLSPRFESVYDTPKFKALARAKGRYSFVAGTISNFSFSPDGNNQYSCTTEITSFSKAMSKLRVRGQENVRNEDEQPNSEEEVKQDLSSYLKSSNFEDDIEAKAQDKGSVVKFEQGEKWNRREDNDADHTYFLSWEEIENIINEHAGYALNPKKSNEIRLLKMDSAGSIIGNFKTGVISEFGDKLNLRTLDPFVCIVNTTGSDEIPLRKFSNRRSSAKINQRLKDDAEINQKREGFLYNLYFEYQFFVDAFKDAESIPEAAKYMLDKASAACFGIWDFEIIADSGRVKVVDRNISNKSVDDLIGSETEEHVFRPNTAESILRDFSFDTNLTDAIKSRIVAQKHTSLGGEGGKKRNAAINGREDGDAQFFQGFEGSDVISKNAMKKTAEPKKETQTQEPDLYEPPVNSFRTESIWQSLPLTEDITSEDLRKDIVATISSGGESYRKLAYKNQKGDSKARVFARRMQADPNGKSPVNGNNVLNINAQFTLDGIGGLTAYQGLRIENIPRVFRNKGLFMIDSISHSVSTDDWTTEVKTSYIVRNQIGDSSGNNGEQ